MTEALSGNDTELFGSVLMFTQQIMSRADKYLDPFGSTTRPWLLLAVLDKGFPGSAPSISEATAVFEKVQYGITDHLTEASLPTALRSAVETASDARYLLITAGNAGNADDEGHAAADIQAGATERVTIWNVDGADRTTEHDTQPDDWGQRVVEFLDESTS